MELFFGFAILLGFEVPMFYYFVLFFAVGVFQFPLIGGLIITAIFYYFNGEDLKSDEEKLKDY